MRTAIVRAPPLALQELFSGTSLVGTHTPCSQPCFNSVGSYIRYLISGAIPTSVRCANET